MTPLKADLGGWVLLSAGNCSMMLGEEIGWLGWLLKSFHPPPRKISLAKEMRRLFLAAVQFWE